MIEGFLPPLEFSGEFLHFCIVLTTDFFGYDQLLGLLMLDDAATSE
jgi:hypothetical protein